MDLTFCMERQQEFLCWQWDAATVSKKAEFQCPVNLLSAIQGLYSIVLLTRGSFERGPALAYMAHWSLRFVSRSLQYMQMLVEVVCEGGKRGADFQLIKVNLLNKQFQDYKMGLLCK